MTITFFFVVVVKKIKINLNSKESNALWIVKFILDIKLYAHVENWLSLDTDVSQYLYLAQLICTEKCSLHIQFPLA